MADLDTITGFLDGYLAFLKEKSSEVRINENVSKIESSITSQQISNNSYVPINGNNRD